MYRLAHLPKVGQWGIALLLLCLTLLIIGGAFALVFMNWRWLPLLLLIFVLLPILESLLLTPLYALIGSFSYYSPMLLATTSQQGELDLHVGTLFDYAMRFRWSDRGPRAARIVTADLLRGLLAIVEDVEEGVLSPDTKIVGTSYFFRRRTMARFGFEPQPPAKIEVLNLAMARLSIALRLSFTRGRFTLPDLKHIQQIVTSGRQLVAHKYDLQRALALLKTQ